MKEKKIILPTIAEARKFVEEATRCDFDIDVFYNRVTIDAKSILGVLSLDLTRSLRSSSMGPMKYLRSIWAHFHRKPQSRLPRACLKIHSRSRGCLKIHSRHLHAPLRGIFGPNSVNVAATPPHRDQISHKGGRHS